MANAKAQVTVYIDGNDPAVVARMQELVTENERFKATLETISNYVWGAKMLSAYSYEECVNDIARLFLDAAIEDATPQPEAAKGECE